MKFLFYCNFNFLHLSVDSVYINGKCTLIYTLNLTVLSYSSNTLIRSSVTELSGVALRNMFLSLIYKSYLSLNLNSLADLNSKRFLSNLDRLNVSKLLILNADNMSYDTLSEVYFLSVYNLIRLNIYFELLFKVEFFAVELGKSELSSAVIAKQLPEYDTVINLYGVGDITAVQLMAEIGDVRRFPNRNAIVGFAGVDPAVDDSGKHISKSNPTTKRGSSHLRKTLFQVISTYVKQKPLDEPVYQFIDKKRSEGKPFYVYTTAAANKFLRIYYARVKEALND